MLRRIVLILSLVVLVLGVTAGVGLLWSIREEQARLNVLLERQLAADAALLEQLSAPAPSAAPANDSDWLPLTVRLVDEAGAPVSGAVTAAGGAFSGETIDATSEGGAAGVAAFGTLPPGEYAVTVRLTDPDESTTAKLLLGPGRPTEATIVCPTAPPAPVDLRFAVEPPDDLADAPLYYIAQLQFSSRSFGGRIWNVHGAVYDLFQGALSAPLMLLLDRDGAVLGAVDPDAVQTTTEIGSNATTTTFSDRLPAGLELAEAPPPPGYAIRLTLVAFRAEPGAEAAAGSTPAMALASVSEWFHDEYGSEPGGTVTFRVDPGNAAEFWDDVRGDRGGMTGEAPAPAE